MTDRAPGLARRALGRAPLVVWLTLVWLLLWGTLDAGTVFFGLVVALLVSFLFPSPVIRTNIKLRPLALLRLIMFLIVDMVGSTIRVAWQSVRYGRSAKSAIVEVELLTDSDHITAMVANAVSLAPGNFVLQIDRENRICYVYSLGVSEEGVGRVRSDVLRMENRIVRAVGSASDLALLERKPA
ncbi:Na+/H+ antiporter subunit E [Saccharopolyspora montiporae]|uniref:Na+/H+ antiporter subunit E n=1 Tax=Saccharopolyspora montiporae TaxID=2781240 RepID=UPI00351C88FE